jgi:hypothetical protein
MISGAFPGLDALLVSDSLFTPKPTFDRDLHLFHGVGYGLLKSGCSSYRK